MPRGLPDYTVGVVVNVQVPEAPTKSVILKFIDTGDVEWAAGAVGDHPNNPIWTFTADKHYGIIGWSFILSHYTPEYAKGLTFRAHLSMTSPMYKDGTLDCLESTTWYMPEADQYTLVGTRVVPPIQNKTVMFPPRYYVDLPEGGKVYVHFWADLSANIEKSYQTLLGVLYLVEL